MFPDPDIMDTFDFGVPESTKQLNKRVQKSNLRHAVRQKREKESLQNQLVELVELLEREKGRENTLSSELTSTSTWKTIAKRHLKCRRMSEAHHEWLRTAIEGKAALIGDLITLVYQHLRTASALSMQSQGLSDGILVQPTDELLYAMYIYELDSVYAQTDAIFSSCGMNSKEETTLFQQTTLATNGATMSLQCGWKQLFPFGFKETCDCLWMLSHLVNRQEEREAYTEVDDMKNTIAVKVRVTRPVAGDESEALRHRFVHRRFVSPGREVSVWKASIIGDGDFRGMQMEETGWCEYPPSGDGAFVQVCVRQVPLHLRSAQEVCQATAARFNEFVQTMVRENSEEATTMAKTLLLENALNGINV